MKMGWCERFACAAGALVMAVTAVVCCIVGLACAVAALASPNIMEITGKVVGGSAAIACDLYKRAFPNVNELTLVQSNRAEGEEPPRPGRR
jgi:hypothetical protein